MEADIVKIKSGLRWSLGEHHRKESQVDTVRKVTFLWEQLADKNQQVYTCRFHFKSKKLLEKILQEKKQDSTE